MDLGLLGKKAIVTGGTRGIGEAISLKLKEKGRLVVANYGGNDAAASRFPKARMEGASVPLTGGLYRIGPQRYGCRFLPPQGPHVATEQKIMKRRAIITAIAAMLLAQPGQALDPSQSISPLRPVRSTLVAPILPEPMPLMSPSPAALVSSRPNGIEPSR